MMPIFSNVNYASRDEALVQPTGVMKLVYCADCDHFYNSAFDPHLLEYGEAYENSLHFSGTFVNFARDLATSLIERYAVRDKRVLDIGCGKGDFLRLICELGGNEGFGFDPSYAEDRTSGSEVGHLHFYAQPFDARWAGIDPDLVTCRQVLEHLIDPVAFLTELRQSLSGSVGTVFYFEVPNVLFTVRQMGIWDLIYEHCQYFSAGSLVRLFQSCGFHVENCQELFDGQYLGLEARIAEDEAVITDRSSSEVDILALAQDFPRRYAETIEHWRKVLAEETGRRPGVVWGAGSKGASFLNLLRPPGQRIAALVDQNPHKQGRYLCGTGHLIVSPESLPDIDPGAVFVMNPIYEAEIRSKLDELGLAARLIKVQ